MKTNLKQLLLAVITVPAMALGVFAFSAGSASAADCPTNVANSSMSQAAECAKGNDQPSNLFGPGGIFQVITNVLLFIIAAVSVIMLIIGGIRYTISQGDSSAVASAKNTILYAIVGIIVAILAYAAVDFVIKSFASGS